MMTPKNRTPLWNVPYQRNPFFTSREEVLNQLHQGLREENAVALFHPHPAHWSRPGTNEEDGRSISSGTTHGST